MGGFLASSTAAANVAFNQAQYSVQESESSLMVCAEISGVPAEGLECDVVVTFVLISNSTKAGMLPPKRSYWEVVTFALLIGGQNTNILLQATNCY